MSEILSFFLNHYQKRAKVSTNKSGNLPFTFAPDMEISKTKQEIFIALHSEFNDMSCLPYDISAKVASIMDEINERVDLEDEYFLFENIARVNFVLI